MITYSATAASRIANVIASSGPSPLRVWLIAALRLLVSRAAPTRTQRDQVRDLAEV